MKLDALTANLLLASMIAPRDITAATELASAALADERLEQRQMAKAHASTYRTTPGDADGVVNLRLRNIDTDMAAGIIAALLRHDPSAQPVVASTGTDATREVESAGRRAAHDIYKRQQPSRQRPLDGSDAQRIADFCQRTGRADLLRETEASAPHALRDAKDDASADLTWMVHAVRSDAIIAHRAGLSYFIADDDGHDGVMLTIRAETGPGLPGIWINEFNCNTAGGSWFANDASAKRAAMKVSHARNEQIKQAAEAHAHVAQQ